eukprot:scaffold96529_cov78-Cyclotella_meneghiniana.AAC.1
MKITAAALPLLVATAQTQMTAGQQLPPGWSSAGTGGECIDSQTSQYSLTEIPASGTVAGCSIPSDDDRATLATLCQCYRLKPDFSLERGLEGSS